MLVSLSENNRKRKLNVFLLVPFDSLDGTWSNIKQLVPSLNLELLAIDREKVKDLRSLTHVGPVTYYKLFLGELLPNDVRKALYLDSDIVVRAELGELWRRELGTYVVGATPDPYVCGPQGSQFKQLLGLSREALYFNAGVLLINVQRWRETAVGPEALRFVRAHPNRVTFAEQCALNWVLRDKWMPLGDSWNVQTDAVSSCISGFMQYTKEQKSRALTSKILHFTGPSKPWHYMNNHPLKDEYFVYLSKIKFKTEPYNDFSIRNFIRKSAFRYAPFALRLWRQLRMSCVRTTRSPPGPSGSSYNPPQL